MINTPVVTRNKFRPALRSTPAGRTSTTTGAHMDTTRILDVVERLLIAAQHPDVAAVEQYGPGDGPWGPTPETTKAKKITGVMVTYQSSATASLWQAVWPEATPVPAPAGIPHHRRAPRLAMFVAQLLDFAKPDQVRAWHLLAGPGIGLDNEQGVTPFGLGLVLADGSKHVLRATATGPTIGREQAEDPFPDYSIPEGVRTCLDGATASVPPN